jgi:hypothetical protein
MKTLGTLFTLFLPVVAFARFSLNSSETKKRKSQAGASVISGDADWAWCRLQSCPFSWTHFAIRTHLKAYTSWLAKLDLEVLT